MEIMIFDLVRQKAKDLKSEVFAVNGISDHIHIAVSINPSMAVSQFVGEIKGRTSFEVNRHLNLSERFTWQESFGVLTFGERNMEVVCDYVNQQKQHHMTGTTNRWLENDRLEDSP